MDDMLDVGAHTQAKPRKDAALHGIEPVPVVGHLAGPAVRQVQQVAYPSVNPSLIPSLAEEVHGCTCDSP
jgi:hypothetical protein